MTFDISSFNDDGTRKRERAFLRLRVPEGTKPFTTECSQDTTIEIPLTYEASESNLEVSGHGREASEEIISMNIVHLMFVSKRLSSPFLFGSHKEQVSKDELGLLLYQLSYRCVKKWGV